MMPSGQDIAILVACLIVGVTVSLFSRRGSIKTVGIAAILGGVAALAVALATGGQNSWLG